MIPAKLITATKMGSTAIVAKYLQTGFDLKSRSRLGMTLLHVATSYGWIKIVKLLTSHAAEVDAVDRDGYTPLAYAICNRQNRIAKFLLENFASPLQMITGTPLLHYAAQHRNTTMLSVLVDVYESSDQLNLLDERGCTPLHWCAQVNCGKGVRILIERGANPNTADNGQQTPLHIAASFGHRAATQALLEGGADPHAMCTIDDNKTPYDYAIIWNYMSLARYMSKFKK